MDTDTLEMDETLLLGESNTVSGQGMDGTLWLDEFIDSADSSFMRRAVL